MPVRIYLDTSVLRDIVAKRKDDRNNSERLFEKLESGDYEVKVPQIVMGEAVTTVMRDYEPDDWEALVGRIMGEVNKVADPATCFPPPDPAVAAKAQEAMRKVKGMTKTDALIAAQALMDPESQKLATTDRQLQSAEWLAKEEIDMRKSGERSKRLKFDEDVYTWLGIRRQPPRRAVRPRGRAGGRRRRLGT